MVKQAERAPGDRFSIVRRDQRMAAQADGRSKPNTLPPPSRGSYQR